MPIVRYATRSAAAIPAFVKYTLNRSRLLAPGEENRFPMTNSRAGPTPNMMNGLRNTL
jgi:hypothetical protein